MNELLTFRQARGYLTSRRASPPDAHMCKQLAQGCTWQRGGRDSNPRPVDRKSGSGGTGRIMQYLKKNPNPITVLVKYSLSGAHILNSEDLYRVGRVRGLQEPQRGFRDL